MVQVSGVGLGFVATLFLAGLFFLATGRGSDTDALAVFPLWGVIFVSLIWRATGWRQPVGRGLALLAAEFLALPLAWLLYQGLPSLSSADPRVRQTLSVLALSLAPTVALLVAGFFLRRGASGRDPSPVGKALLAAGGAVFAGEALYGLLLLVASLSG
jgi:hypothetical protein